jgi:hypothetical protein
MARLLTMTPATLIGCDVSGHEGVTGKGNEVVATVSVSQTRKRYPLRAKRALAKGFIHSSRIPSCV